MAAALWIRLNNSGFALQTALSEMVSPLLYRVSFDSLRFDTVGYDEIVLTGRADLSEFIIGSGKKKYIPQAPFAAYESTFLERENDSLPFHIGSRTFLTLGIELMSPGMAIASDSVQLRSGDEIAFEARVKNLDSDLIRLEYVLSLDLFPRIKV